MKPITAMILMIENMNSASPYPLIPKRLIATMPIRKMVTK